MDEVSTQRDYFAKSACQYDTTHSDRDEHGAAQPVAGESFLEAERLMRERGVVQRVPR